MTEQTEHELLATTLPIEILIAEDDLINQKVIERVLTKLGYTCDIVGNGKMAVAQVQKKKYGLIFMDMQMPEMDGREASRIIAEICPGNTKPIIVALTANVFMPEDERTALTGIDDHLSKPYKLQDIEDVIQKWGVKLVQ